MVNLVSNGIRTQRTRRVFYENCNAQPLPTRRLVQMVERVVLATRLFVESIALFIVVITASALVASSA